MCRLDDVMKNSTDQRGHFFSFPGACKVWKSTKEIGRPKNSFSFYQHSTYRRKASVARWKRKKKNEIQCRSETFLGVEISSGTTELKLSFLFSVWNCFLRKMVTFSCHFFFPLNMLFGDGRKTFHDWNIECGRVTRADRNHHEVEYGRWEELDKSARDGRERKIWGKLFFCFFLHDGENKIIVGKGNLWFSLQLEQKNRIIYSGCIRVVEQVPRFI